MRLQDPDRAADRHGSGGCLRREGLDLQRSVAAGEFSRDVGQIHALGVVAHTAVGQLYGTADLRIRGGTGHRRIDRHRARHVPAARLHERIQQADVEFSAEFQIEGAIGSERRITA